MKRSLTSVLIILFLFILNSNAQKLAKPWNEWSKKDLEKILNDSAWAQTQVETNTSEMFYTPTAPGTVPASSATKISGAASDSTGRAKEGASNQATSIKYHVRFLSAKPIRQAIARSILLDQKTSNEQLSQSLNGFIERNFDEWIVLTVSFEASDGRLSGKALQMFQSMTAETLKNNTYLERKDGKRLFLLEYKQPINDGLGAKFIFQRVVDGKSFLSADDSDFRFVTELGKDIKLNVKFKAAEMMYGEKLEY